MATRVITAPHANPLTGAAALPTGLLSRLGRWLDQRRRYRATVRELEALDDDLLTDIGVHRSEIATIARRVAARGRWR